MMRHAVVGLMLLVPAALVGQDSNIQNATLRRAIRAYESLDFPQVIVLGRASLRERLTAPERARAEELLGFAFSATNLTDHNQVRTLSEGSFE